jgi:hypothetical protein
VLQAWLGGRGEWQIASQTVKHCGLAYNSEVAFNKELKTVKGSCSCLAHMVTPRVTDQLKVSRRRRRKKSEKMLVTRDMFLNSVDTS